MGKKENNCHNKGPKNCGTNVFRQCLDKIIKICLKNSKVNFRQNVRVGPQLVCALWSVRFTEVSALERLRYESFLKNLSGTNDTVCLRQVSALEDVCVMDVSLYFCIISSNCELFCLRSPFSQSRIYRLLPSTPRKAFTVCILRHRNVPGQ